jgi:hypothetical protein
MIVAVRSYPQGPRVWVAGQRVHHGSVGVVVTLAAITSRRARLAALVGAALVAHDRHDWKVWFVREALPIIERAGEVLDTELSLP